MMRALAIVLLALGATCASAAPLVVSDPLNSATAFCGFKLNAGTRTNFPVVVSGPNKICQFDAGAVPVGINTLDATAVPATNDTLYKESDPSAMFTLVRPAVPVAPTALVLTTVGGAPTVQSAVLPANVTACEWTVDGVAKADTPVVSAKCSYNLAALPAGSHQLLVAAIAVDPVWGRLESAASLLFTYVAPTALPAPPGLRLQP